MSQIPALDTFDLNRSERSPWGRQFRRPLHPPERPPQKPHVAEQSHPVGTEGHTVIDQTGIEGSFSISLETSPDDPFRNSDDALRAVVRELGLKLETTKGPTETIMVESIDHPSAN